MPLCFLYGFSLSFFTFLLIVYLPISIPKAHISIFLPYAESFHNEEYMSALNKFWLKKVMHKHARESAVLIRTILPSFQVVEIPGAFLTPLSPTTVSHT